MSEARKTLPQTMVSPQTGEVLHRGVRPFTVTYKGHSKIVQLPGYYSEVGNDGVHVGDDMIVTDTVLRELKEKIELIPAHLPSRKSVRN